MTHATEAYYENKITELMAVIARVRSLHSKSDTSPYCVDCGDEWPCMTIEALNE